MLIRVLGAVEVIDEASNTALEIGRRRQREVLALLAARHGEAVAEEWLIGGLWSDDALPENPRRALQTYISHLRGMVGAQSLLSEGRAYRLTVDTDASRFERAVAAARSSDDVTGLRGALDMWQGAPFGEFGDKPELVAHSRHLRDLHAGATEDLAELLLGANDPIEAAARLQRVLVEAPDRERATRLAMIALYRAGRQSDALRVFQSHRAAQVEAGLEPSPALVTLEQQLVARDPALDQPIGRRLGSYELFEEIGEGAFGSIYRAAQPAVDREVAIKVVRAELANDPDFVRRFEHEAQTVARLEHPHIVPLHDFWRDPSGAYLVMRFLRGGSAEQRLVREGPMTLDQVATLVDQVGAALAVAHAAGVVHRDVKPANILFDDADNAYLADFGIAVDVGRAVELDLRSAGSPLYVAPEQVRDGESSIASDVYAFGVVLHELLTGVAPFGDSDSMATLLHRKLRERVPSLATRRPDIPQAVDLVIQTATDPDTAKRFPSMSELVLAFRAAAVGSVTSAGTTGADPERPRAAAGQTLVALEMEVANPYKGLAAFGEADAGNFFGRDALADELLAHVEGSRLLVVTGPSGSGKSSVVRAGLVPRLRERGFFVVSMVPGAHPFEEVETALQRVATGPTGALLDQLTADPRGLLRAVRRVLPDEDGELVIVVDQFEELFTLTGPDVRDAFLSALSAAVTDERSPVRVVCTLRADFYDRPLQHDSVSELVRVNTIAVTALTGEELEAAITQPAARVGVAVDPPLVAELVADVRGQAAALPLLQYALTEVYDRRSAGHMGLDAYRGIGGMTGALANRADELAASLGDDDGGGDAVRRLFTRLVTPGEGAVDTRRRVLRSELGGVPPEVIDTYGDARLLTFDHDPTTREPTVEIAHEAILREWPRLAGWLDQDRDGLRILRHLGTAARAWEASGYENGELYRGGRLEAAAEWASEHASELTERESSFLAASSDQRRREGEAERRQLRRLRTLLGTSAAVAVLALIAGVIALQQRRDAREQRSVAVDLARVAEERAEDEAAARGGAQRAEQRANDTASRAETARMASEAAFRVFDNRPLALLLAAEAAHRDGGGAVGLGGLQRTLANTGPYLGTWLSGFEAREVRWRPDGSIMAAGPTGFAATDETGVGTTRVDVALADEALRLFDGQVFSFSRATLGEQRLAVGVTATDVRRAVVADLRSGEQIGSIDQDTEILRVAVSEELGLVATFDVEGTVRTFELPSLDELWTAAAHPEKTLGEQAPLLPDGVIFYLEQFFAPFPLSAQPPQVRFLDDGSLVASWGLQVSVWNPSNGERLEDLYLQAAVLGGVYSAAQPGLEVRRGAGRMLWFGNSSAGVMAAADGSPIGGQVDVEGTGTLSGTPKILDVWWTGSDEILSLTSTGKLVRTSLVDGSTIGAILDTHVVRPTGLTVSPDGRRAVVAGLDGVTLVALDGSQLIASSVPVPRVDAPTAPFLHPDGDALLRVVADANKALPLVPPLVRVEDGEPTIDSRVPEESGFYFWFDRVTGEIFTQESLQLTGVNQFRRYDPITLTTTGTTETITAWDGAVMIPGTDRVLVARSGTLDVFDLATGGVILSIELPGATTALAMHPDGHQVAVAFRDHPATIYSVPDLRAVATIPGDGDAQVGLVRYTTDGATLITEQADESVALRDPTSFDIRQTLVGAREGARTWDGLTAFVSSDGERVLGALDGQPQLWDIETGQPIGGRFPHDPLDLIDGAHGVDLAVGTLDGHVLLWDLDVSGWADIACQAAGRNMTREEWERLGPTDEPYRTTCPQWPG